MIPASRLAAALAAGAAAAVLASCGIDTKDAGTPNVETTPNGTTTTAQPANPKKLPTRPRGVVAVEGPRQGSLTPAAIGKQNQQVNFANVGETQGFKDLCAGRIDVLDTSRIISAAEQKVCNANGVVLTDNPIQVASDAVVVATRNEHDVGGDCLRISTLRDIFKRGSLITNWNQVGFFNIPLRTTGREAASPTFQFFAQKVLGVNSGATLGSVRADYIEKLSDTGVREEVTNAARLRAVREKFAPRLRLLRVAADSIFRRRVNRAIDRARNRVLRQIDAENARRAASKVVLTEAEKQLIADSNRRRVKAATDAAQARAQRRGFTYVPLVVALGRQRAALRKANQEGAIGIFRFSYYELYENALRPMEVWDPAVEAATLRRSGVTIRTTPVTTTTTTPATTATGTTSTSTVVTTTTPSTSAVRTADGKYVVNPETTPWCVFPSQTTITNGSYPLARRLFLYVSKLNLKRPEVRAFLRSYLANAQALATSNRLIPIPDTVLAEGQATINGTTTPQQTTTTETTAVQTTATTPPASVVPGVASPGTSTTP